ncbi:hypothetical protein NFI96_024379 [Prochilodus magdalenae]|nr:hypothetical protein NFI96_024379 [Prochilodus magdalenae]
MPNAFPIKHMIQSDYTININHFVSAEKRPTRSASIFLRIMKDYINDYDNSSSEAYKSITATLAHELAVILRTVEPQNFKNVVIVGLKRGSIIVNSTAEFFYPNNQSEIVSFNQKLERLLNTTFNNPDYLKNLSKAVQANDESRFYLSTCDRRDGLWRRRGECYAACNIIQHDRFGGGSVMVWGGISLKGRTDLYRLDNRTLTAIRHQDEILGPVARPYAGAVGPGFLLVHNSAWPHVARVCRQFLENEGIDTIDWPTGSPDLNPIEYLRDIVDGSIIITAHYNYPNNQTQMDYLNNNLESTLRAILNSSTFMNLSEPLHANVSLNMSSPEITNIAELKLFLSCVLDFANFTMMIQEGSWICEGPCKTNPKYCNHHGDCLNGRTGPQCQCYENYVEEYHGEQCELYSRGAGFYAALFGSLAGAIILLIILITITIFVLRRRKRTCQFERKTLFEDDSFDFSDRGQAP